MSLIYALFSHPYISVIGAFPYLTAILQWYQGSHATWKTWNFVIFFSRPGKCLEFAQKVIKTSNFNSEPGKNLKFVDFMFQDFIYKIDSGLLLYHICIINTNTDLKPNWLWIPLLLPGNNMENTWNFVWPEKWESCICFNTFRDFYN